MFAFYLNTAHGNWGLKELLPTPLARPRRIYLLYRRLPASVENAPAYPSLSSDTLFRTCLRQKSILRTLSPFRPNPTATFVAATTLHPYHTLTARARSPPDSNGAMHPAGTASQNPHSTLIAPVFNLSAPSQRRHPHQHPHRRDFSRFRFISIFFSLPVPSSPRKYCALCDAPFDPLFKRYVLPHEVVCYHKRTVHTYTHFP